MATILYKDGLPVRVENALRVTEMLKHGYSVTADSEEKKQDAADKVIKEANAEPDFLGGKGKKKGK